MRPWDQQTHRAAMQLHLRVVELDRLDSEADRRRVTARLQRDVVRLHREGPEFLLRDSRGDQAAAENPHRGQCAVEGLLQTLRRKPARAA